MDGNLVERELYRASVVETDPLSGIWDSLKSIVKGSASEGARAAVGTGAGLVSAKLQGKGVAAPPPSATKTPSGLFIALGVVALLGFVAFRSKKGRR